MLLKLVGVCPPGGPVQEPESAGDYDSGLPGVDAGRAGPTLPPGPARPVPQAQG